MLHQAFAHKKFRGKKSKWDKKKIRTHFFLGKADASTSGFYHYCKFKAQNELF